MKGAQNGQPPDTRATRGAAEWPFVVFVLGLFLLIVLRVLLA
jgi:hypothetical protein